MSLIPRSITIVNPEKNSKQILPKPLFKLLAPLAILGLNLPIGAIVLIVSEVE